MGMTGKPQTVYSDPGFFAGWPANHGHWQWGDEMLFGFMRGRRGCGRFHDIVRPYEKLLARSTDGGLRWSIEVPNVDFSCSSTPTPPPAGIPDSSILRFCGVYDTGGMDCLDSGGYYQSLDRGHTWQGPHDLGIGVEEGLQATFRTCVVGGLAFLTFGQRHCWGKDFTACYRFDRSGIFRHVGDVLHDEYRAVMPAAAKIGDRLVCALRRIKNVHHISIAISDDGGRSWVNQPQRFDTGRQNGNPPALVLHGDSLVLAYGNRDTGQILCSRSTDGAESWTKPVAIREGSAQDIGYCRLFSGTRGAVCVYYWNGSIEATVCTSS